MAAADKFPEKHWRRLQMQMGAGGSKPAIRFISRFEDPIERLKLYLFAQNAYQHREWTNKNLQHQIEVAEAGIAEGLAQAEAAEDPGVKAKRTDFANVVSYNLAAMLADCWEGDPLPRGQEHYERGLRAAEDCLKWRAELGKGPFAFSIAHWAKGMHLLSLGRLEEAVRSFGDSLAAAEQNAREESGGEPDPERDFGVALGRGFVGVARVVSGDSAGRDEYEAACRAFEVMAADESKARDAVFGLAQLRHVWSRYGASDETSDHGSGAATSTDAACAAPPEGEANAAESDAEDAAAPGTDSPAM